MATPNWNAFAAVVVAVLALLIALARASQRMLAGPSERSFEASNAESNGAGRPVANEGEAADGEPAADAEAVVTADSADTVEPTDAAESTDAGESPESLEPTDSAGAMDSTALLVNVAASQGAFGVVLIGAAVLASIPPGALGVDGVTPFALAAGVGLGVALFAANELGQRAADVAGIEYEDDLRDLLTPESVRGWALLLGVVLPVIAGFEELLFRGALIGAMAAGFGVSPWLLAVASTAAFAAGHGAQGPGGIVVTGLLGFVLAAAFVLTGSLLVVVLAHYLVNALEFVVHAAFPSES